MVFKMLVGVTHFALVVCMGGLENRDYLVGEEFSAPIVPFLIETRTLERLTIPTLWVGIAG